MRSHHSHHSGSTGGTGSEDVRISRRALGWLLAVLVPLLIATIVGLVLLWPTGTPKTASDASLQGAASQDVYSATVTSTAAKECAGTTSDQLPNGTIPKTVTCASVKAHLDAGPDQGKSATVQIPPQIYRAGISPGDGIQVARYPASALSDGSTSATKTPGALPDGTVYAWSDFSRSFPLAVLALAFAVLVVAVGRLRGLGAIFGLGLSYLAVVKFMLPALRLGENPVAVALVGSIAVMTVVLYLAHGVSAKTTTALLGTVSGLALTAGLADWASHAGHLNGLSSEENAQLTQLTGTSDLSGVILCGIIVAGLGVLNDVTITQAAAVWEVRGFAPDLGFRQLFVSGMHVGRDHLASTVYTIAFAYAGAALPTLILIDLYDRPLDQVLTSGQIAEEIVRTLVGAIGLILAIPLTTAVAAAVVAAGTRAARGRPAASGQDGDGDGDGGQGYEYGAADEYDLAAGSGPADGLPRPHGRRVAGWDDSPDDAFGPDGPPRRRH